MSRSHNEDWERKKSYLIRSLFHDVPFRALSPVTECTEEISTHSSDTQLPEESTSSPEIYSESKTTTSSTPSEPLPPPTGAYTTQDNRPCSPLPPLIIEPIPNKHDDPPEYYQALLKKMRWVYRKMFIEGKDLSDEDFFDSDSEKHLIQNEVFEMAGSSNEVSEVSNSFSTDGYSADTESSSYELSNHNLGDSTAIENYNEIQAAEKVDKRKESNSIEYSNNSAFPGNNSMPRNEENVGESLVSEEEADYRQITTQADVHIVGAQLAAVRPSPVYEGTPAKVIPTTITEAESPTLSPILSFPKRFKRGGVCACQEKPEASKDEDAEKSQTTSKTSKSIEHSFAREKEATVLEELATPSTEDFENFRFSKSTGQNVSIVKENEATVLAELATPSTEDFENFRFSKSTGQNVSFVKENEATVLAELATPSTEDFENLTNEIEVMKTPRPRASVASIPIDTTRLTNCDPRNISSVTSASQDGGHGRDSDHRKTSCDINDVLTSTFNVSSQANIERASKSSSSRKRVYEEISSQTENVSWSDLRANFFVGTPKILRLCSCKDHVCN